MNISLSCYVCENNEFETVFNSKPSMSSDGQTVDINIHKQQCQQCGTIRTAEINFLNNFYENYYRLNIENTDPMYVYKGEKMLKSQMHFEWINKIADIDKCESMIEIGCGSGNLLSLFEIPNKFGIEPSKAAADHASKIASVQNIGFEELNNDRKYDFIFSSCVIEHTVNPNDFLQTIKNISKSESVIIIGLPIQDTESFDVYFLDHLHHFTANQFIHLCQKNGFKVEHFEVGYKCMLSMGYFVLSVGESELESLSFQQNKNLDISQSWIENMNSFLEKTPEVFLFGYGETSFFFQTYTQVNKKNRIYIDDTRAHLAKNVITTEKALSDQLLNGKTLILLTNPEYHDFIISKFESVKNISFYSPFSNAIH